MTAGLCGLLLGILGAAPVADAGLPRVRDDRLVLTRFATEPEIVTPVGLTVDPLGRVLVVESHTHFRPKGYTGPAADRLRLFEDRDGDGVAEAVSTFWEGSKFTMGAAFHPINGTLYVATRYRVFRLDDLDHNGRADGPPVAVATLDTDGNYPHNGLSGFAFDPSGRVYFGLGENLGASYSLVGTDGTRLSGGGEGGNVYRCDPDGQHLERVATGFWNPFAMAFDVYGRLFVVDNDPDSRPPCRLLQVVPGGDYGYRFRNGRKGLHPFTAWNGELPGTLPMAAGTGEAPSGVVVYESDGLPDDYRGRILSTSWGDHRIEMSPPIALKGASFQANLAPVVTGGENFRPVGMAVAPDGSIYISDWVDRSYDLHSKGRVWKLRGRDARPRSVAKTDDDALENPDRATRESAARRLAATSRTSLRAVLEKATDDRLRATADALAIEPVKADDASLRAVFQELARPICVPWPCDACLTGSWTPQRLAANDPSPEVRSEALRPDSQEWWRGRRVSRPGRYPRIRSSARRRGWPSTSRRRCPGF
ncbi:MAG: PVC-type heme-binding CxxCH protein [Isosphaeraceae bacterium]